MGLRVEGLGCMVYRSVFWTGIASCDLISRKVFLKSLCKSQFPHKFVISFFTIVIVHDKLTDLFGS